MPIAPEMRKRRIPKWSILSAAMPFVGAAIGYIILLQSHGGEGAWSYIAVAVLVFLASAIAGIIVSVIALIQCERPRALSAVALLLNAVPAVYVILSRK
jgi:hypothetical protein